MMCKLYCASAILALLVLSCNADVYMQSIRGSNNRLNEAGTNRDNANRLFNSQNNDKGGYCFGPTMNYYSGSILPIEWTSQHSCGNPNVKCNIILQYMCGYSDGPEEIRIRDGTTTQTIQDNKDTFNSKNANGDFVYGMHESYQYYQDCKARSRQRGLFTADQNLNSNNARATRQSPGGAQYGFECSEERDYYPYWAPSPWKDVAIMTDGKKDMCKFYQAESQNVKERTYCTGVPANKLPVQPLNEQDCKANGGTWNTSPSWGIDKPECIDAPWGRDNHLGNGFDGATHSYNWTLPTDATEKCLIGDKCTCVLRLRYNITSGEIDGFAADDGSFTDSRANANPPLSQDPDVLVSGRNLSLAVNTNQHGRTFQDRSYVFKLSQRPANIPKDVKIYNLGVRGKRGNIVQTFPATEYDFVPSVLPTKVGDYIHVQWTGCDTNPDGNDGEGTKGTDRSNMVQTRDPVDSKPLTDDQIASKDTKVLFKDDATRSLMAHLGQTGCKTYDQLVADNNGNDDAIEQDVKNCFKLNAASPYFNGGLVKMTDRGTYYYMSTRNNNFSNRSQKGVIVVDPLVPDWGVALIVIGAVVVASVGAGVGGLFWARKHPHGKVANVYSKVGEKFGDLKRKLGR